MVVGLLSRGFLSRLQIRQCHRRHRKISLNGLRFLSTDADSLMKDSFSAEETTDESTSDPNVGPRDHSFFVTDEQDPANHTSEHRGKFYTVPPTHIKEAFAHGMTRRFTKQSNMIGDVCLMVRKPALDIISDLKGVQDKQTPKRFVLYGPDGSGKTLSLLHVLHFCYTQGWLVVHIPDVFDWLHCAKTVISSMAHPGLFDIPDMASTWLQNFRNINRSFVSTIQTRQDYTFGRKQELIPEGSQLSKVIEMGLSRPNYASPAIDAVVHELGQETNTKILFAVNNFNGLFYRTTLRDSKGKFYVREPQSDNDQPFEKRPTCLLAKDLTIVQSFRKLLDPVDGLKHGAMVFSLSRIRMYKMPRLHWAVEDLLGHKGMKMLGEHTKVEVPDYSDEEMISALDFYHHKHYLSKVVSPQVEAEVKFLTQRNPQLITKLCAPF